MSGYQPRVCEHGHSSSCPEDRLCQVRLGGERFGRWETVMVAACDSRTSVESWRSQCGPIWRRRNHETRVIRVADAD